MRGALAQTAGAAVAKARLSTVRAFLRHAGIPGGRSRCRAAAVRGAAMRASPRETRREYQASRLGSAKAPLAALAAAE